MSVEMLVELGAAGLAAWAAWLSLPNDSQMDADALFKVALSTALRGARTPEEQGVQGPWIENLRSMFPQTGSSDIEDLLREPELAAPLLGAFGKDLGWNQVAEWSEELKQALALRTQHLLWVGVETSWAHTLARQIGPSRALKVEAIDSPPEFSTALLEHLQSADERVVLVCEGNSLTPTLAALHAEPVLRDRLAALIGIGCRTNPEWLAENFTQENFDVELNRAAPYLTLARLDADHALPDDPSQHLPDPPVPSSGRRAIDSLGLGAILTDTGDEDLVARALWIVLTLYWLDS